METKIIIHDYHHDEVSGRIHLHLKSETTHENATWTGPIKTYSCDQHTLNDRFNGSIDEFEQWAAKQHKSNIGIHPDVVESLSSRKGKVIG